MANSYSTPDLLRGALAKCGEPTTGTSPYHAAVLRNLNRTYEALLSGSNEFNVELGQAWEWARETNPRVLVLKPAQEAGTVSLVNGSVAGTFSGAVAISQAGRWLKIADRPTFYRILTHVAGATAFTLDSEYLEATGTALTYKALPVQYDLGEDILRLVEPIRIYDQEYAADSREEGNIFGVDLNVFRGQFPLRSILAGVPTRFTTVRSSETSWLIEMNAYLPSTHDPVKCDVDVIAIQPGLVDSEDSIPLVPRQHRIALEYGAAFLTWANDKKNDEEAGKYLKMTQNAMQAMIEEQSKRRDHVGVNVGAIIPRPDLVGRQLPPGYYE